MELQARKTGDGSLVVKQIVVEVTAVPPVYL
jgi:hypothetical protein